MYRLPELNYSFDALEPHLDAETVKIHYSRHHQKYCDNVNALLESHPMREKPIEYVLSNLNEVPEEIRQGVINNGGGYANHNLYWSIVGPNGGDKPTGKLADAIDQKWGNFEDFKKALTDITVKQFGSGWGWLVLTPQKKLEIMATSNQVSPYSSGYTPILNIDVWEHAYYLKYQNKRPDYVENFFKIINWKQVGELFEDAMR
jgi:Fe-Mn family superoxide dismutase